MTSYEVPSRIVNWDQGEKSHGAPSLGLKVFTLLPTEAVSRLMAAANHLASIVRAPDDIALLNAIHGVARATVMLDPSLIASSRFAAVLETLTVIEAHVVVFTTLTPEGIQATLPFVRGNAAEVVLRGYDDDVGRLQNMLSGADRVTVAEQVLLELTPVLAVLPLALREGIMTMFLNDQTADSTKRLAAAAHMTRRSLDRWLSRAGIVSARLLVAAPKVVRAYTYLRHTDVTPARAAAKLGFSSARPLEQHCRVLLGVETAALRREITAEELVARMVRRLIMRQPDMSNEGWVED